MWIKDIISLAFDLHYSQDRKLGVFDIQYWMSIWMSNNMKKHENYDMNYLLSAGI